VTSTYTHGIQDDIFNDVGICTQLNPFKHQQNWNTFPILHHTHVDIHPLLWINNGHFIYTNSNVISL
jgi:hypothetical protein